MRPPRSAPISVLDRILAVAPEAHILLRATTPEEATAGLAHLSAHPPVYVHIELVDPSTIAPAIGDRRMFALGFARDLLAARDLSAYEATYASGVTMIQSNRPDLLGAFLAR